MRSTVTGSRKLTGYVLGLAALLILFAAYLIASLWSEVSEVVVAAISASITTLTGGHQVAQAAQDRAQAYSPNYPAPPASAPPPEGPRIP